MTGRPIEELEAEARYHRERLALYRARAYGSQDTSGARMRELQQASDLADKRLRLARRELRDVAERTPGR